MAHQLTIMVVDDDPGARTVAVRMLADAGFDVIEATDGANALEQLAGEHRVDAVLTDINMPNLDGWELGRRLRTSQPELPVVYMSGDVALDRDFDLEQSPSCLGKPFDSGALVEILSLVCRRRWSRVGFFRH
ncbi:MAG: response regulator [Gemmatimonadales bacterium]|nr:response regulator [Gemmatimonadales bacterium]